MKYLEPVPNVAPGSLWLTYAKALFGPGDHSGKVMGLAAYGDSCLAADFYDRFTAPVQGVFTGVRAIKDCWPDYDDPPFLRGVTSWTDARAAQVARAIQDITTKTGVEFVRAAHAVTHERNLVLGGGVALNGYLTSAIRRLRLFDDMHVPPAVHDGGIALGAALFAQHHVMERQFEPSRMSELAHLGHSYPPPIAMDIPGATIEHMEIPEAASICAELLSRGEMVAVHEGRSEHGPRALGNRSLLASASIAGHRDEINARVKLRERFRPLAPVIHIDRARDYFEMDWASPYMMYIVKCTDLMRSSCAEACHVDGTARIQTIATNSGFLSQVLTAHERTTGIPVLINTSFNLQEPIIETPRDALATFWRMPVSTMWLDGLLIRKKFS